MVLHDPVARWEGLDRPLRHLPRRAAIGLLAVLAAVMVWSAVDIGPGQQAAEIDRNAPVAEDDGDLALYARISDRVAAGEPYYVAAMAEQRAGNYPTRPFVTVRLPTLAMLHAQLGLHGVTILLKTLLAAVIIAVILRIRRQTLAQERIGAGVLMLLGGAAVITPDAALIHEVLAGLLLSLALAIYHPDRWWPALIAAALALSLRELALPFVLLWLAFALSQRRWPEVAAVGALMILFAIGMYLHFLGVEAQRLPGDGASQGWDVLAGLRMPIFAMSQLTALLFLPLWLAAPFAILPLVGWAGLGGRLGLFAAIWFAGFFAAMALFARAENFYWVQMTLPAYFAGFAFAPRAFADLAHATRIGMKG